MKSKLLMFGSILLIVIWAVLYIKYSDITGNTKNNLTGNYTDIEFKKVDGMDFVHTDNYANTRLEYYYYIPPTVISDKQNPHPLLVMIPGLSGRGEYFVTREFKEFADEENFMIISPSFIWDEKNWESRQSYQYPSVWSGDALLEIVNKLKRDNNVRISKLYLFGFSAGAQFSLRFCLWKPELCAASAAHGNGGTVIPDEKTDVKFFITVGKMDTSRIENAKKFYDAAQNYGIYVVYKEYNGGHSLTAAQIEDSLKFFKDVNQHLI